MQNQKLAGWGESADAMPGRKVVLNASRETFESLRESGNVKLRLFCNDGCSVIVNLESKDREHAGSGYGDMGVVCLTVTRRELLDCLQSGLEVVFYDKEYHRAVPFRATGISKDCWLGDVKPLYEPPR